VLLLGVGLGVVDFTGVTHDRRRTWGPSIRSRPPRPDLRYRDRRGSEGHNAIRDNMIFQRGNLRASFISQPRQGLLRRAPLL
jgi:hypothetical protein